MSRLRTAAAVLAECAARESRVMADLDDVLATATALHTLMVADGVIRPTTFRTRAGDPK